MDIDNRACKAGALIMRGRVRKDYSGQTFGRVTVIKDVADRVTGIFAARHVLGKCSCGVMREFYLYGLTRGTIKCCGCYDREVSSKGLSERRRAGHNPRLRHGHALTTKKSKTYQCWANMIRRCSNPKATHWIHYGGRGISVCERWLVFDNFLADMGEAPLTKTLDRINNDGNYELINCRWITMKEQRANRRDSESKGIKS